MLLRKKKFKINKPKLNLIFVSVPSIFLYTFIVISRYYSPTWVGQALEENAVFFFMLFMVVSRMIRSVNKITKQRAAREKKKYKRDQRAKKAFKNKK